MSGEENNARRGRLTAFAGLAASAALFMTALSGIATIDPSADAAAPQPSPAATHSISDEARDRGGDWRDARDCPWRHERPGRDVTS